MKKVIFISFLLLPFACHASQRSSELLVHKAQSAAAVLAHKQYTTAARRIRILQEHLVPQRLPVPAKSPQKGRPYGKHCILSAVPHFKERCCLPLERTIFMNGCYLDSDYL